MGKSRKAVKQASSRTRALALATAGAGWLIPVLAHARTPMAYTASFGTKNDGVVSLLWGLIAISLLVLAIVAALLLVGLFRRRDVPTSTIIHDVPLERPEKGLSWIYIGSAISAAALFGAAVWTFAVLAAVSAPATTPALSIHVRGHQWWWEVEYESGDAARVFATANEIHIPTGQPVQIELSTADVIHSFWVPQLSGKTDTIPQQRNVTWIEAEKPGTYRGQCTEYCGLQHAHMALAVIAEPEDKFKEWWVAQLQPAAAPGSQAIERGQAAFQQRCAVCHTVRGTAAGGRLGPDLTHLMSRTTIASGTLPNTVANLSGWIADPQHVKPGNYMPVLDISAPELAGIRTYLETLR
jgi:cytochrome c oxidase subunit II